VIGPADSDAAFCGVASLSNGADRICDKLRGASRVDTEAFLRKRGGARWQCGTQSIGG
jgi:hypothetical protein